ncbi:di-trans,poly-cis-decaprenylcistransferase [Candidatus Giovannonibacteria bacterium RIFCSPHIGHO2_01_FULL_45_24]|uniref:Isoprenyl transferase n=1 Tax=Candidatus Giovannonibacteria bacterium RIFCSPLOWO2_01_FULL_46_32 TaxID=1798353 RepID=A0A1F5XGP2_9BACT|nr:MAG: di-trans,poly-cis-decaprenylcistransferase [Candidatus Giovannonibacteria bacterium RIFCSPHIGHO2_01_FULL_45_24]OGF87105.1 MAG: di-trans,poly-cis-decaprenylcistransferase [Candidatus Giovannonibacteria bacterium RIFCSPLOWO2_01_FULL_46_32]
MQDTPLCVGIILDGNRRWAKERGLPFFEGHRQGLNNVEPIALAARDMGIKHLALYAFSTENWERPEEEVSMLMSLFETMAKDKASRLAKEGARVRFVGQLRRFSENLQKLMRETEEKSPADPKITIWILLSYGGRADIAQAAGALAKKGEAVSEESLARNLWTAGMPDPDIIIRTGGEQRLSNFLLWQAAYSELFFPKTFWPEFTKEEFENIVNEYKKRERRNGT